MVYNIPKTYYSGYESFCYQNCLRLILEADNVPNAPLYINCALSLILEQESKPYDFKFSYHEYSRVLIPEYSCKVKRVYYDNNKVDEVFNKNIEKIREESKPIIVGVDVFYLPYSSCYHKNHATHTLILCDYSEESDFVDIIDWYDPWFYNGTMSKEDFLLARSSDCPSGVNSIYSGWPIENNWAEIDTDGFNSAPEKLLATTLKLTLDQYFLSNAGELVGVRALDLLKEVLTELTDVKHSGAFQVFKKLHGQLYIALKRHRFFKQYLEISDTYLNLEEIKYIVSFLSNIIGMWDGILMLILKASMVDSLKTRIRIIDNMNKVIEKENILGEKILELYKNIDRDC